MKKFVKLVLAFFKHPYLTLSSLQNVSTPNSISDRESLIKAADWLINSQNKNNDSGYSRKYSLCSDWDKSYIETSGYIIPSMYLTGIYLDNNKYIESAINASEWLLTVQNKKGFFTDIDEYKAQVFDTGQVLIGLNFIYKKNKDPRFLESISKACEWLLNNQEKDGSWIKNSYNSRPHTYYTRVASALLESGYICKNKKYVEAAKNNLDWAISQKQSNEFFYFSEFKESEDPILHTLVYILEGFSEAYRITSDKKWLDILTSCGGKLLSLVNEEGLLYSQYNSNWEVTNNEYCITGLAQLAGIFYDLANYLNSKNFFDAAEKIMKKLKYIQILGIKNIDGAFPSSLPLWGYYGGMEFFNWNSKFYIDAALKRRILTNEYNEDIAANYFCTSVPLSKF